MKNDQVMSINVQAQKWYLAYFGPKDGHILEDKLVILGPIDF